MMRDECGTFSDKEALELLASRRVRITSQRVELAKALFSKAQHVSAEGMYRSLRARDNRVCRATVYNNIKVFVREGLLRKLNISSRRVFYDTVTSPHHHFFNEDTGELVDFKYERPELEGLPERPAGTEQVGFEIVIWVRNQS